MTVTTALIPLGGGSSDFVVAEDVLAGAGGVIRKRGTLALRQNVENGFPLMRQHVNHIGGNRPAPSIGDYPQGLWLQAIGQELDGYGSMDSGTGTYLNLGRDCEGVYVTMSWWWALKAQSAADVGEITFYCDTEGWGSLRRSYFAAKLVLATGKLSIQNDAGVYVEVATVPVPGWNDNKYDRHYTSFTVFIGPSTATGTAFGQYGAFQIGSTVVDLRNKGGGSANYPTQLELTGSSFSGGRNPGIGVSTPNPGRRGGIVVYDFLETIGDVLV